MRRTRNDLRARSGGGTGGRVELKLSTLARRFRIVETSKVAWRLNGMEGGEGDVEQEDAELFPGIGIYARPKGSDRAEALVVKVGGESGHPVVVAVRDEDMRRAQAVIRDLGEGEVAVFNHLGYAKFDAQGNLTIHSPTTIKLGASAVQPLVRGTVYRAAEDALLTSLATLEASVAAMAVKLAIDPALAPDSKTAAGNVATPAGAFVTALGLFTGAGASYLSTKGLVE